MIKDVKTCEFNEKKTIKISVINKITKNNQEEIKEV